MAAESTGRGNVDRCGSNTVGLRAVQKDGLAAVGRDTKEDIVRDVGDGVAA